MSGLLVLLAIVIGSIGIGFVNNANDPLSSFGAGDRGTAKKLGGFLLAVSFVLLFLCIEAPTEINHLEVAKKQFLLN